MKALKHSTDPDKLPRKDVFDQESGEKEKNEEIIRGSFG